MKSTNGNIKGFSLVELLVVVLIIAVVAAIAIPSLLASKRSANEASAVSSLRTIHSAQVTYFGTTGGNVDYATNAQLVSGGLIDSLLGGLTKSGYTFTLQLPASAPFGVYCANAAATSQGVTGNRRFGVDSTGVIWQDPSAAVACAAGVLTPAGTSSALQ